MAPRSLDLSWCPIEDDGLAHLRNSPLQSLCLRGCHDITDAGIASLVDWAPLKALNLTGCVLLTEGLLPILAGLALVNLAVSSENFSDESLLNLIQTVPTIAEVHIYTGSFMWGWGPSDFRVLCGQASSSRMQ